MHFCYERAPICGANKSGVWLLWSINILCLIAYAPDCQSCILASSHLSWIKTGLSFNIHTLQEHQKAPCTRGHSYQYQRTENSYLYQRTKYTSNNGPTIYTSSTRGQKQLPVPEDEINRVPPLCRLQRTGQPSLGFCWQGLLWCCCWWLWWFLLWWLEGVGC